MKGTPGSGISRFKRLFRISIAHYFTTRCNPLVTENVRVLAVGPVSWWSDHMLSHILPEDCFSLKGGAHLPICGIKNNSSDCRLSSGHEPPNHIHPTYYSPIKFSVWLSKVLLIKTKSMFWPHVSVGCGGDWDRPRPRTGHCWHQGTGVQMPPLPRLPAQTSHYAYTDIFRPTLGIQI